MQCGFGPVGLFQSSEICAVCGQQFQTPEAIISSFLLVSLPAGWLTFIEIYCLNSLLITQIWCFAGAGCE